MGLPIYLLRAPLFATLFGAACTIANPNYEGVTSDATMSDATMPDARDVAAGDEPTPAQDVRPGATDLSPADDTEEEPQPPPPPPDASPPIDTTGPIDVPPPVETAPPDTAPRVDVPPSGLVGHWSFDEGAGSTVSDRSGKGNHGTIVGFGIAATAWQPGKLGSALEIPNLVGLAVSVAPSTSIDAVKTSFTIAAWVKRKTNVGNKNAAFFSRQYGPNNADLYTFAIVNDALVLWLHRPSGASASVKATQPAPLGAWLHAVATWDGATVRLFQDGVAVGSGSYTDSLPTTTNPLLLGNNANQFGLNQPLAGLVDEVRFYDRVLTSPEIAALVTAADL